jgi:signal transduction histidine kinase
LSIAEGTPADDFVSEVAHELKTPIAVIAGYAELLGARDDDRTRREAAKEIGLAATRLAQAVDDLLDSLERDSALAAALAAARASTDERGGR